MTSDNHSSSFCFLLAFPVDRCEKFTDLSLHHALVGTSIRVRLLLYTRDNDSCAVLLSHTNLTEHPQFNLSRPTTFIIHGFRPSGSPPVWVEDFTKRLLGRGDINVVVVDWNYGAANIDYFKVVRNTYKVAENLTAFIRMMKVQSNSYLLYLNVVCPESNTSNNFPQKTSVSGS